MRKPLPPLFLRAAILLAVGATLAGVAGLTLIPPGAVPAEMEGRIVVVGAPRHSEIAVEVSWESDGHEVTEIAPEGKLGWNLPVLPAGVPARVVAMDRSVVPPRELARAVWMPGDKVLVLDARRAKTPPR